jgi:hypothetical protein
MSDADILPTLAVLVAGTAALLAVQTRFSSMEARWLGLSFLAHILSSAVQLWMVLSVYGIGDMMMYHSVGIDLANAMRNDFVGVAPQVLLALLQQNYTLSIFIPAAGSATGSMCALLGFVDFALGDSLVAANLLLALTAFFGKLLIYVAFRRWIPSSLHRWLIIAILLVPSSVFWSSGILKEAVAMPGMGLCVLAADNLVTRRSTRFAWVSLMTGGMILVLVKPYILVALMPAIAGYLYWRRSVVRGQVQVRPFPFIGGTVLLVVGVLTIGELSPRFSVDRLGDETARLQEAGWNTTSGGGSTYMIGDPGERTLLGQVAYAPIGLATALYRPLPTEVRNPQMALSAIENLVLIGLTLWAIVQNNVIRLWRMAAAYPLLVLCALFVIVFGVAVGLTSANLGTLSRYRIPLMPFFCTALMLLTASPLRVGAAAPAVRRLVAPLPTRANTSVGDPT